MTAEAQMAPAKPGVYFDLPFRVYREIPACSNTALGWMLRSPAFARMCMIRRHRVIRDATHDAELAASDIAHRRARVLAVYPRTRSVLAHRAASMSD